MLTLSNKTFSFLEKYGYLYNFWIKTLLEYTNFNDIISQQIKFLEDLINNFKVYKNISKLKNKSNYEAGDLYLKLLGNPNKNVDEILFLRTLTDQYNKEIYLQVKILFNLREEIFKKLVNKEIIRSDFDQLGIKKYEENIAERIKLRKQKLDKIKEK